MKRDGGTYVKSQSLRIQNVDIALKNTCTFERTARTHLSFPPQMHTKYHLLKKGSYKEVSWDFKRVLGIPLVFS